MDDWNTKAKLCGNCRHWPLGSYQHDWEGAAPSGISGYGTDGTVSDCRRHAPKDVGRGSPGKTAVWPKTEKTDSCGDFDRRADGLFGESLKEAREARDRIDRARAEYREARNARLFVKEYLVV